MKKFLTITAVFLVSLFALSAAETITSVTTIQSKELSLGGAYGDVLEVAVDPIAAQSTSFMQGMPFNIENSLTWAGVSEYGREIANWQFLANCPFRIDVIAENLRLKDTTHPYYNTANRLYYKLTFTCNPAFTYVSNGNEVEENNILYTFTAYSLDQTAISDNPDAVSGSWQLFKGSEDGTTGLGYEHAAGTYAGSSIGSIYFQFTEASTELIEKSYGEDTEQIPSGNWVATVTLRMVAI